MRKLIVVLLAVLVAGLASPADASDRHSSRFPSEIDLPTGFFPEGIAIGRGNTFYVGSLSNGTIYRGDLRTGEGAVLTAPAGQFTTIGIDVDRRERVWVAGGPTGATRVYDGRSGDLLETYQLTNPFESFLNDVIVTRNAVWVTDSGTTNSPDPSNFVFAGKPRLFKIPLRGGRLPDASSIEEVLLDVPDVAFPNLNGIETAPGGRGLIVAHTSLGSLFKINPKTGSSQQVDVGVEFEGADGLARRGRTLYVVENGAARVAKVRLDRKATSGEVVRVLPVVGAETPTTAAIFGNAIYVVDARFNTQTDPYKVFRLRR